MKLRVFGNDNLFIEDEKFFNKDGSEVKLRTVKDKVEIDFFGRPSILSIPWIYFTSRYRLFIPEEIKADPTRLVVTKNPSSPNFGTKNSYVCWFREPIEYRDGFRIIARFPNYAIDKTGNIIAVGSGRFLNRKFYSYLSSSLYDNLTSRAFEALVHRVVCFTFNPPTSVKSYSERPFVNHIDGDKTNSRADNLEWVTAFENHQHALETGLIDSEEAVVLDTRTNEEMVFPSLQKAADFIGRARLTIQDIKDRVNQKPFKKYFKIQLVKDKKPWVEYNREMFIITETNKVTGETYTYPDMREFRIAYALWNQRGRGGLVEMIKLVHKENPDIHITYQEQYKKSLVVQVREMSTGKVYEFESVRDASRKLNLSFCLVLSAVKKGDGYHNGGYQFRHKSDKPWSDNPRLAGKVRNIYKVFDSSKNETRTYDSERKFAREEGIPYQKLLQMKRSGKKSFKNLTWTMEQVTYEMKYKFNRLKAAS